MPSPSTPVPFRVGLTGGIASGKSTVAEVWRGLGAAVVDADLLARAAVAPGTPGLAAVVRRFGAGVVAPDGSLDRAALRALVFADPGGRRDLESITHPEIQRLRTAEEARLARAGARVVVHEVPLLYEAGLEGTVDLVVVVDAPDAERRRRLVVERGLDPAEAEAMMAAQMDPAEKRRRAHVVVENAGSREALRKAAAAAWEAVLKQAEEAVP